MKLTTLLEKLSQLVLALGFIGYIELRAHINLFGFTMREADLERYLQEIWYMMLMLMTPTIKFLLVFVPLAYLWTRVGHKLRPHIESPSRRAGLQASMTLVYLAAAFILNKSTPWPEHWAMAIGPLTDPIPNGDDRIFFRWFWFTLSLLAVHFALGQHLKTASTEGRTSTMSYIRSAGSVGLLILALQLPVLFALCVRPASYDWVQLTTMDKDNKSTTESGLLIFTGARLTELWRARNGKGEVVDLRSSDIREIKIVWTTDILKLTRDQLAGDFPPDTIP